LPSSAYGRYDELLLSADVVEKLFSQADHARPVGDFLRFLPTNEAGELGF
jgi:hypothetical protein